MLVAMADADDQAPTDDDDLGLEPGEHARFHAYLGALAEVSGAEECDLVSSILKDPDQIMAEAAVIRHLDRRAASLDEEDQHADWCRRIAPTLRGHELLERRVREWSLLKAISAGWDWSVADLVAASDWLQRKTSQQSNTRTALTVLAGQGRTRRVRNAARSRLSP